MLYWKRLAEGQNLLTIDSIAVIVVVVVHGNGFKKFSKFKLNYIRRTPTLLKYS